MRKSKNYLLLVTIGLIAVAATLFINRTFQEAKPERKLAVLPVSADYLPIPGIVEIRGYRKWHRVNAVPVLMDRDTAARCYVSDAELKAIASDPHGHNYFTVYVNPIGQETMTDPKKIIYPVGSIIVKEKLPSKTSKSPELLTVMVKRQKGFNSANGDWEFLGLNGTATKIEGRGKLANCQSCHVSQKENDYVYGFYADTPEEKMW